MKKLKLTLFILAISSCLIYSQEISRSVLACSGGEQSNSTAQLSYTVGESISGTCNNSSCYLSLGFQQVFVQVSSLNKEVKMYDLNIYPNPVGSILNLKFSSPMTEAHTAILIDLNGQKVGEFILDSNTMSVDVNNLPQSIYILQVFNKKGNMQTFKLIKN